MEGAGLTRVCPRLSARVHSPWRGGWAGRGLRQGTIVEAMMRCYNDPLCVAFDHNTDDKEAWAHRIPAICAEFVGATYMDGTTSQTTGFYQLKVEVLTTIAPGRIPGMWDWLFNFTIPGARDELPSAVKKSEEMQSELEGYCGVNDQAQLPTPAGTGMAWLRAFGTFVSRSLFWIAT